MHETGPAPLAATTKVRAVLPCRILTSRPELYQGLAALVSAWGLPCRVMTIARGLLEPTSEPGLDLVALEGEQPGPSLREVVARKAVGGRPVVALLRRGRPRLASLALALGCDDGIAFPVVEDELRWHLDLLAGHALLVRELELRERVCERWREPGRAPPGGPATSEGLVLLVGAPSPVQVELANALPLKRVVFVRAPRAAAARLAEEPPVMVVVAV